MDPEGYFEFLKVLYVKLTSIYLQLGEGSLENALPDSDLIYLPPHMCMTIDGSTSRNYKVHPING